MKNSLIIVIILTSVLVGETIGSSIICNQHDVCVLDSGMDGEAEEDTRQEKELDNKLQVMPTQNELTINLCVNQSAYNYLSVSSQVSIEVVTPPPKEL